jgi:carbamoyltransferase
MKIIGIQKHHNSSACLLIDGELVYYNQEERLSRIKKDNGIPVNCLQQIKKITDTIDKIIITGYDFNYNENSLIFSFIEKMGFTIGSNNDEGWYSYYKPHHLSHAARAFYSSNFDEAVVVVWDGSGSEYILSDCSLAYETTTAFKVSYPHNFEVIYKRLFKSSQKIGNDIYIKDELYNEAAHETEIRTDHDIGHLYEMVSKSLGFEATECGKLMGLQSYGKTNNNIPNLILSDSTNMEIDMSLFDRETYLLDYQKYPSFSLSEKNKDFLIDFAYHTQKTFEKIGLDLLQKLIKKTNCKNLILTGGASLNVVANNYFRKNISPDIKIFIDPLCGDEGNSIGSALLYENSLSNQCLHFNKKDVYLGPAPSYEFTLKSKEICREVSIDVITKLLEEANLVALFQGRSEGGPRALGNRSILFDPRIPNGKDTVNLIKKREHFRPFGCSVMLEHANKWFDMHYLDESPFMMYAVEAYDHTKMKVPAIVHVDNTSRVQTVTKNQNKHLYQIIENFFEKTGIPILLNTSFNLAGNPLVETIEDALTTLRNSNLEYLYLPEIKKLIYIENQHKVIENPKQDKIF